MSGSQVLNSLPGPYLRTDVNSLATYLSNNLAGSISTTTLTGLLTTYIQNNPPTPLPLTAINPDFESNKADMINILAATNSWSDVIVAGIGETISEMIATATTYSQLSIEKGVQESIIDTAVLDSSIYGVTRMLGVKIQRRIPANVPCNIYSPISTTLTVTITAYTQFQIAGVNYFNRTAIIIPATAKWSASTAFALNNTIFPNTANGYSYICTQAGTSATTEPTWPLSAYGSVTDGTVVWTINTAGNAVVSATLYQGQVSNVTFTTNGTAFEIFEFGNSDFSISNYDVNVSVTTGSTTIQYLPTNDANNFNIGLWEFSSSSYVFEESTNSAGNVELKFGNGTFGALPLPGSTIAVQFVITSGQEGNASFSGQTITCSGYSTIGGVATSSTTQGSDQISAFDYKNLGPGLFSAKYRAVTPQDYNSIGVTYPGVIDALFQGQAIFAPNNLAYCMVIQCYLLTNTAWTTAQRTAFITYIQNIGCTNVTVLLNFATPITINITATIYCTAQANLTTIQNNVITNFQSAFTPSIGSLGYSWYNSDVESIIRNTSQQIDYFDTSYVDVIIPPTSYAVLGTVTLTMVYSSRPLKQ
jgi:hypothetical protein